MFSGKNEGFLRFPSECWKIDFTPMIPCTLNINMLIPIVSVVESNKTKWNMRIAVLHVAKKYKYALISSFKFILEDFFQDDIICLVA